MHGMPLIGAFENKSVNLSLVLFALLKEAW